MLAALEPLIAELRPDAALVYGDTNSTLAGALAAAQARVPVVHVEAGMRSFDRAMPEELNRVLSDHLADLLLCSSQTAAQNLPPSRCPGEVRVVGDVMVDVALRWQPAARERSEVPRAHGLEPGGYLLLTAHRAGNVDDPARLRALVELIEALPGPVLFPLHPRTRERLAAAELLARLQAVPGLARDRAARLRRVHRAAVPRARGADRLRGRPEGGVPCGRAVRDAASEHRVGRDRGGRLEHARGPRRRRGAGALERPAPVRGRRSTATATRPSAACRRSASSRMTPTEVVR